MNAKMKILFKYLALLCILVLLGSTTACNLPLDVGPDTQFEEGPPPDEEFTPPERDEEPPPEEEYPGEDVFVEFEVDRQEIHPGECTLLWWHVEGGFGTFLNGELVEPIGERELCLEENAHFILEVDKGDDAETREIEVMVIGLGEPPPGEEPMEEEMPEDVFIDFFAERMELHPGECTVLIWHTEGGFGAFLNGEPIERSGEMEVCLEETMFFVLGVDMGEEMEARELEIFVAGMPGEESPQEESQPQAPPSGGSNSGGSTSGGSSSGGSTSGSTSSGGCPGKPVIAYFKATPSTIKAGQSAKLEWGSVTNGNTSQLVGTVEIYPGVGKVGSPGSVMVSPTATTTYALTGTGCGGSTTQQVTVNVSGSGGSSGGSSGGAFSADIQPTDIYPGNQPHGQFHVRITNHGPGTLNNHQITVFCSSQPDNIHTKQSAPGVVSQFIISQSMKPGETHSHPTNLTLDFNTFSYVVECELTPSFTDPNMGNNKYGEGFNGVKYIGP